MTDRPVPQLDVVEGQTARVERQHALAGHPAKLKEGEIRFQPSTWNLPVRTASAVTMLTLPLMRRYGYLGRARPE